jgi:hypothetical protein
MKMTNVIVPQIIIAANIAGAHSNSLADFGSLKRENPTTMAGKNKLKASRNMPFLLSEVLDRC